MDLGAADLQSSREGVGIHGPTQTAGPRGGQCGFGAETKGLGSSLTSTTPSVTSQAT